MKKLVLALCVSAMALASCTTISGIVNSNVPAKTAFVAANAFNVVEASATGYVQYCTPKPAPVGCNDAVIQTQIVPNINKGIAARSVLVSYLKAGSTVDAGVYQKLLSATSALQSILAIYHK